MNDILKNAIVYGLGAGLGWTVAAAYIYGVVRGTKTISVITGILWIIFVFFICFAK
jgi:Na+-transporting NADH:ubiquinone oxidoreductase subunit NqrE